MRDVSFVEVELANPRNHVEVCAFPTSLVEVIKDCTFNTTLSVTPITKDQARSLLIQDGLVGAGVYVGNDKNILIDEERRKQAALRLVALAALIGISYSGDAARL